MFTPYKVLLPKRILKLRDKDFNAFMTEVKRYMEVSYPHYDLLSIEGSFALCDRKTRGGHQ